MYIDPFFEQARKELEFMFNQEVPKPFKVVVALEVINVDGGQVPKFTPFPYCPN
jgi:hypothetical protein